MYRNFWNKNNGLETIYFCDICGKIIKYDEEQSKYISKDMYIPYISTFSINKYEEIVYTNHIGDYHFHPNCFEKLKNGEAILLKRKTSKTGRESFKKTKLIVKGGDGICFPYLTESHKK